MKYTVILCLSLCSFNLFASFSIEGKVSVSRTCKSKELNLVLLSKKVHDKDHYLYQVEVPANGKFKLEALKGKYLLRVLNDRGCTFQKEINLTHNIYIPTKLMREQ